MTLSVVKPPTEALISDDVRNRLTRQLINEHAGMSGDEAVRIVAATVAFLKACADNPESHFRPSLRVDLGWHQFILNTVDYAEFCERVAGRFLHHVPEEFTPPRATGSDTAEVLAPTVDAMRAAGFTVDPELWATAESAQCSQCHAGCTNCGQGGDGDGAAAQRRTPVTMGR
ncbi:glycine-rich domain-containing protein [Actinosynnema sp. NPDC053489]|uniref:glycine-rich domain-containing protein n=1 Tax=Actinosynnema sp. NPDC053489 TaxID=3363916 RepID=UPI0037C819D3